MNILAWLSGCFTIRGKAMSYYKRGIARSKGHDHAGAISDYTTAMEMPGGASDVKAMAQYNRAMAHLATKNDSLAIEDLNVILAMKEGLTNVKTMARQELARIARRLPASRA